MEAEVKKLSEVVVTKEPVRHERPNEKRQEQTLVDRIDYHLVELHGREAAQKLEKPEPASHKVAQKQTNKPQKVSPTKSESEIVPKPKVVTPKPKTLQTLKPVAEAPKPQLSVGIEEQPEHRPEMQTVAAENPLTVIQTSQVYEDGVLDTIEPFEPVITDAESLPHEPIVEWEENELLLTTPLDGTETFTDYMLALPPPGLVSEDYFQVGFEPSLEQITQEPIEEDLAEKLGTLSPEATAEVQGIMEAVAQEIQKLEQLEVEGDINEAEAVEARLEKLVTRLLTVLDIEPDERTVSHFIQQLKVLVVEQTEAQDTAEDEGTHERKFGLLQMLKALLQTAKQYELPHLRLGRLVCRQMALSPIL